MSIRLASGVFCVIAPPPPHSGVDRWRGSVSLPITQAPQQQFLCQNTRLISRDRLTKHCVFLKILTNFLIPFCFAAMSFLPKGIGSVFVDYSDIIRKTVNVYILYSQCCFLLLRKLHYNFFTVLRFEKIHFRKYCQMFTNN